ncbi:MAG TPA: DUF4328 domain-containing protein, partial [Anaerolineae bacterium]|nr:DUF4328 domain-containing protein [Anaerolineae bacterium]
MAGTDYVDSAHRRAIITSVLLAANALLAIIMTVSYFMQLQLVNQFITGPRPTLADATANDARVSLLANINLILLIVTGIVFLFWIHRAYDSLSTIGAYGLNYSPGWAVGGFFVPILNFVRPYQVVREMWKASDPAVPDGYLWTSSPVSPLVLIWWLLWIGAGLIGNYIRLTFNSKNATLDQFVSISGILLIGALITAIDAVLAMVIVLGLDARQQQKSRNPRTPVNLSPVVSADPSAIAAAPVEKKAASRGSAETFFQRGLA